MRALRFLKLSSWFVFLAFFLGAGLFFYFKASKKPREINVVLIIIDALRADHLGCYGYKRNTSPNIDRLAREGALFTQAIAQSSHTSPALGAIATSAYPPIHGLHSFGSTLNPRVLTLAETLKAHGYKTIFVGGSSNFRGGLRGFARGFDVFDDEGSVAKNLTQKAAEFLEKDRATPFFLWLHYMDVHNYNPEKKFESAFMNDPLYDPLKKLPVVKPFPAMRGKSGIPAWLAEQKGGIDNPDYYVALYDGAIRSVDEQLGLLFQKLKEVPGNRKTLVILTADHGEMMGEHGYYFLHGTFLYEPLLKVPFILCEPGRIPSQKTDVQIRASLDIFPTILGFLTIKKPKTLEGIDLTSILKKNEEGSLSYVISDEGYSKRSVRTGEWKLICSSLPGKESPKTFELFHLRADPGEMNDVSSAEKNVLTDLKKKLLAYMDKYSGARKPAIVLDEETRQGLKSLGYLQ